MDPKPPLLSAQTIAAVRVVIIALGSIFVGRGLVSQETLDTFTDPMMLTAVGGGVAALVSAGYAVYSRRPHGIIRDAAALSQVQAIVTTTQKTADEIPSDNVVHTTDEAAAVVRRRGRSPIAKTTIIQP